MKYVVGFCFDRIFSRVLLVLKERPSWQRGLLNGLGGKVEDGESPSAAMEREFREETLGQLESEQLDWEPFARLTCADPDNRQSHLAVVWFFRSCVSGIFPTCMHGLRSSGEELQVVRISDLSTRSIVPNVEYLVPMARIHFLGNDRSKFFEIEEGTEIPEHVGKATAP